LSTALAHWDGRGPTPEDDYHAGKELAAAAIAVPVWDLNHPE
jgi:hypothetical protein